MMEEDIKQFIEQNEMMSAIVNDFGVREGLEINIRQFIDGDIDGSLFSLNLECIYPEIM